MLTDTHTHLYSSKYEHDREAMMQRAMEARVTRFFVPAIDSSYADRMYTLESQYPDNVFLMMGLHPVYVKPETFEAELDFVEKELARRKFYAVGEIGCDLYWDKSTIGIQKEAFGRQIGWAKQYGLPINIHCRDEQGKIHQVQVQNDPTNPPPQPGARLNLVFPAEHSVLLSDSAQVQGHA